MVDSHKCPHGYTYPHLGDDIPLPPEILNGVANTFYATGWILMLSSPRYWNALRRIPPKAFLLERLDAWLAFAMRGGPYVDSLAANERKAAIERRSAPFERLRDLLVDWQPPLVTSEIHDAATALYIAEFSRAPDEGWDRTDLTGVPLEAMLLWPEGEWDEQAFLAGQISDKPSSGR